ncbi:GNAT family N-acetyltransferase [Microlunatus sp. GCM10028923]|uniref:GNAT family N-acetyltransferase n=1 Tax=Microlunatus sp. GCM10028923 TaxID=3273400 RepID=UPI00360B05AE
MTQIDPDQLSFHRDERRSRYEARLGETGVGVVEYSLRDQTMIIVHTGTKPEFRGNGIAARISAYVLDDARRLGLRVVPECPFTAQFIADHPEYADLVA